MSNKTQIVPAFVLSMRPHTSQNGKPGFKVDLLFKNGTRDRTWIFADAVDQWPLNETVTLIKKAQPGSKYFDYSLIDSDPDTIEAASAFLNS